jgi:predicted RNase H-like HicB family nuclease
MLKINYTIEKSKEGFFLSANDINKCFAMGKTKELAIDNLRKEIEIRLDKLDEEVMYKLRQREIFTRYVEFDI